MHSSKALRNDQFAYTRDGQAASFDDILPGFGPGARVGIVSRTPGGALGASVLLLAAITAFYDAARAEGAPFFRYPDYFIFHLDGSVGPYGMLDVWPDHKEVTLPSDPETLLRAINDRAISHLLIEDGPTGEPAFSRETLGSVGLRAAYAFAADGRPMGADSTITGGAIGERYVDAVIKDLAPLDDATREGLRATRAALLAAERPTESYRTLTRAEALALLAGVGSA
jgi:hypothetical protein